MANWYILAYHDELNRLRIFPEVLHVQPGDNVIWASNISLDQYVAGQFSPATPQLFPLPAYGMPPNNESKAAAVQPDPLVATPYLYTCTELGKAAADDGDSSSGIIIVDPPGTPGPKKRKGPKPQNGTKKKGG